jgi:hypothetical protein
VRVGGRRCRFSRYLLCWCRTAIERGEEKRGEESGEGVRTIVIRVLNVSRSIDLQRTWPTPLRPPSDAACSVFASEWSGNLRRSCVSSPHLSATKGYEERGTVQRHRLDLVSQYRHLQDTPPPTPHLSPNPSSAAPSVSPCDVSARDRQP